VQVTAHAASCVLKGVSVPHDQTFKQLLETFFYDFLRLFLPDVALAIDPGSIEFVPPEAFTDIPAGEQRTADLAARAYTVAGEPEVILLHTEVEMRRGPEFGDRMWEYNVLFQLREKLPVLSIALQLRPGTAGVSLETYHREVLGVTYRHMQFWQVGLRDLNEEAYEQAEPPLAAALCALMRPPDAQGRAMLKFRLMQRIAGSRLDEARTFLLLNVVETYLELDEAEQAEYRARLGTEGGAEVEMLETTWAERKILEGREQGRAEGQRAILRRVALARFGVLPPVLAARIDEADQATLDVLAVRLATAATLGEAGWA